MSEESGQPPGRTRRSGPPPSARQGKTAPPSNGRGAGFRHRLRRDSFLFVLCLAALGMLTATFALTWRVTGGALPLVLALASLAPAFALFYLRDS